MCVFFGFRWFFFVVVLAPKWNHSVQVNSHYLHLIDFVAKSMNTYWNKYTIFFDVINEIIWKRREKKNHLRNALIKLWSVCETQTKVYVDNGDNFYMGTWITVLLYHCCLPLFTILFSIILPINKYSSYFILLWTHTKKMLRIMITMNLHFY